MIVDYTWIMDIVEENTADVCNGNHIKGHNYNDIYEEIQVVSLSTKHYYVIFHI